MFFFLSPTILSNTSLFRHLISQQIYGFLCYCCQLSHNNNDGQLWWKFIFRIMTLEKDDSFVETEKKSKKRKHDKLDSGHFIDAVNMGKDAEKVKKKQKKTEIHQDVGVYEDALETKLNWDHRQGKKEEKKKKHKVLEDKSLPLSDHIDVTLEGSDIRDSKKKKKKKKKKKHKNKDECNIEMGDGKLMTEKIKKARKKEKDNGGHKGEKKANNQVADLSKESEKKKRKREKKAMKNGLDCGLSATENNKDVTEQVEKRLRKKKAAQESNNVNEEVKKGSKKVTFSSQVEVFPLNNDVPKKNQEEKLVRGKRFTLEEDEKIKEAVYNYIKEKKLPKNGLDMIMNCKRHSQLRYCWNEISIALPHRPLLSVYCRAHNLFERADNRNWSKEERDIIKKFHAEHGPKWKKLSEILGRHFRHIKDTWRSIKPLNKNSGRWSQEEYQSLFDLVHSDLKLKIFAEKKYKHGMLKDNIGWSKISDALTTRTDARCCLKWYGQLSSRMVGEGVWSDSDDYRLLGMLFHLDACSVEEVDWDNLIEHRSGEVCRKRWNQMVRHIGSDKANSFPEQVDLLSQRYKLDALEARVIWENKPYTS